MKTGEAKKELQTLASKTPSLQVLWLYGSRAKGNAESNSDYDLAAAFSNRETLPDYYSDQLASDWAQKNRTEHLHSRHQRSPSAFVLQHNSRRSSTVLKLRLKAA